MQEFLVNLSSVEDIKAFVVLATTQPFEVYVESGTRKVSAKSFMGMFSLDYAGPVRVTAQCEKDVWDSFSAAAERFRVPA